MLRQTRQTVGLAVTTGLNFGMERAGGRSSDHCEESVERMQATGFKMSSRNRLGGKIRVIWFDASEWRGRKLDPGQFTRPLQIIGIHRVDMLKTIGMTARRELEDTPEWELGARDDRARQIEKPSRAYPGPLAAGDMVPRKVV